MARGRFVSKAISLDEKVDALSDDTCRLLFTWLIPHLDCEGRIYGDAQTVKSIVFPRRNISVGKIEKYLKELEIFELIFRYFIDGNQYLCMKNFEKHQPGLQKIREAQSQIPAFTPELLQSNVGVPLTEVKDKVKDKEETKDSSSSILYHKNLEGTLQAYSENIGELTGVMEDEIKAAVQLFSAEWVIDAIKEAVIHSKPTWVYTAGILKNWAKYGREDSGIKTTRETKCRGPNEM